MRTRPFAKLGCVLAWLKGVVFASQMANESLSALKNTQKGTSGRVLHVVDVVTSSWRRQDFPALALKSLTRKVLQARARLRSHLIRLLRTLAKIDSPNYTDCFDKVLEVCID